MDNQDIKNRIVRKMLRNRVVGDHKKQIDTVVGWAVPSHAEGQAKTLIDEMVSGSEPVEQYGGGARENIRLTSVEDAVEYLKDNGGDVPFGFD
ncbi:hypothetical protein [Halorhabdus rudnickae]|uniref:hypothetical protein n=1 Tax=Halorhabdus rudnickae TaxID=1775544 RepID=UPI0010825C87|nr:hypothetical protein [Halorhabdus rudnickae]